MARYQEKRTPIKGSVSTTPMPSRPRTPAGPGASMTESIPSGPTLPRGTTPLPRRTFEDQKRVDKVYRWR